MLLLLATLGFAAPAAAQPPDAPPVEPPPAGEFGAEVDVTEVLLDVLVTDRKGNVIVGLGPEDFVVEEDGDRVEIESASFYSNRTLLDPTSLGTGGDAQPAPGGEIDVTPRKRYFILLFHEQQGRDVGGFGSLQRQLQAGRDTRRWIEREILLDDWVAVLGYDVKLKVHQDFTHDRELLLAAVDAAIEGKDPGGNWPSRIPESEGPQLRAHLPRGEELDDATDEIHQAITTLAEAAGRFVGRKNLIYYSTGFGEITDFGQYKPDPRFYPPMVQALNDNNVAVYSVDLVPPGVDHVQSGGLNQIAEETGGEYYFNFTSFGIPLGRIAEENSGYYLLSYRARHARGESGFQRVEVSTTNPEFRVRARDGYLYGEAADGARAGG